MEHRTRDGRRIEMRRLRDVEHASDERGWVTHRVVAVVDGADLGHLTISWIPHIDTEYNLERYRAERPWADQRSLERFRAFHGQPYVAAVLVHPGYWRQHIGLALYREAALWLAQDWKLRLRSGDPNPSAEGLWAKLVALGEPVVEVDVGDGHSRMALDYCVLDALNSSGGFRIRGTMNVQAVSESPSVERPKCAYRMRWEDSTSTYFGENRERLKQGLSILHTYYCKDACIHIKEQADGKWKVEHSFAGVENFTADSEQEAKSQAFLKDYARITRNFLVKVSKGVWKTANGRIRVEYCTSQELNKLLPIGHAITSPGYAIFVDDNYAGCGFSLRKVQMDIGIVPSTPKGQKNAAKYDVDGEVNS